MSSRVLRRLREESNLNKKDALAEVKEQSDSDDYESEEEQHAQRNQTAFHLMMDDDDSDSSSSDDEGEEEDGEENKNEIENSNDLVPNQPLKKNNNDVPSSADQDEEEEDIDAILSEFKEQSIEQSLDDIGNQTNRSSDAKYAVILYNNDSRDYNLDSTMRNMLHGTTDTEQRQGQGKRRAKQNQSLFARQRDSWGKRPSSYIGGGLGMDSFDRKVDDKKVNVDPLASMCSTNDIPWPYSGDNDDFRTVPFDMQQWYTFQRSNTYSNTVKEYQNHIANTGDINTMAMYIADNPFVVEPMFHFAMFFFSIGENEKGMDLLKRILWVMECASYGSFLYGHERCDKVHLMDYYREENHVFFLTLFRLAQTSCMVGCVVTSLAVGRFLLSLDPMRDPTGTLMVLDYYALATMREKDVLLLLQLVDSNVIKVCLDEDEDNRHICELRDMPNWAYSYALAMYRKSHFDEDQGDDEIDGITLEEQADNALDHALSRYPFIVRLLLEKNGVNVKSRSFRTDWPSVIDTLDLMNRNSNAGVEKISSIFVERNSKLWSGDDVLKWLFRGCQRIVETKEVENTADDGVVSSLEALEKYSVFDPMDFQDSFRRIPADANPLDPGLMDAALNYTPNRRRFLRMNRQQGGRGNEQGLDLEMLARQQRTMLGTGRNGMQVIDPDLPLMELFWRSMMPWARVDGVPPNT